ncbi:MAG: PD-(D/E)XK nuclease family protein, partial [Myxococcota bacterium]|nr:PD-(D/E)XK nuclease family protein [Myxococcota bacterium]
LGRPPLGGRGGGVAVLALREVRGRTFSELFVLGTNRGNFPKVGGDDPLLPESVRGELRGDLPFLPCAASEARQERHLFAQLLSMSPRATLCWQKVDASGRPAAPSPLLAVVGTDGRGGGVLVSEDARPAIARELPRPSPPEDHLARVAIYEPRAAFAALLPGVVEEGRRASGAEDLLGDATRVAASRVAVLGEFDPDLGESAGQERWRQAGPFLGLVGSIRGATDPRARPLSASALEGLSYCPWQTLLGRYLVLSELPDPLAAVPHADRRLVGILVHRVLEVLVLDGGLQPGGSLEEVLARSSGVRLRPPSAERLAELTLIEARSLLAAEGLRLPGLDEILQRRALTFLDRAFEDGSLPPVLAEAEEEGQKREILGVEVDGVAELSGRRVSFRADRVDRVGDEVVFVDYKTGGGVSAAVRPATREKAYLSGVASGRRLQAAVYAASQGPLHSRGRFLFLRPDLDPVARRVEQSSEDEGARELAAASVSVLAEGLEAGVLFPRLVEPTGEQEPVPCKNCSFSSACLRGDSGARGRLARIARALESGEVPDVAGPSGAAFAALWKLPATSPDGSAQ